MSFFHNFRKQLLFILTILFIPASIHAVIILDNTFAKNGFTNAEALANEPQFKALMYSDGGKIGDGSRVWIGNYQNHGYVLTAGHMFTSNMRTSDYVYKIKDGHIYRGQQYFKHPLWNGSEDERTGYDFTIVQLTEPVTDAGAQPSLYSGNAENKKMLTFMGYGWRGTGSKGQNYSIDTKNLPAAAEGLIEKVVDAKTIIPHSDSGNFFGIWLPKEDGSLTNPFSKTGITKPQSESSGLLGSGDSGGPAWIKTQNGWAIAGINSNGNGNAAYGNKSWFARISAVKSWIQSIIP
jgi:hypothetical protein